MIPVVEDYLSELLEGKLSYLKKNPSQYQKVLGINPKRLKMLTDYLNKTPIKVIKGYPREPTQLPCLCILLSSEEESPESLGNIDEYWDERGTRESRIQVKDVPFTLLSTAEGKIFAELVDRADVITSVSYKDSKGNIIRLSEGEFFIHSNHPYQVQICTSALKEGDEVFITYYYTGIADIEYNRYMFDATFRIEAWGNNGDLVVDIYHLAKWALLSGRDYLGKDKLLFQQRVSGADFQPAPNFFPEFVYRRALSFWCQYSTLSIHSDFAEGFVEGDKYIERIEVTSEMYEEDGRNGIKGK